MRLQSSRVVDFIKHGERLTSRGDGVRMDLPVPGMQTKVLARVARPTNTPATKKCSLRLDSEACRQFVAELRMNSPVIRCGD